MARETGTGKYYYRNSSPVTAAPYTISAWAYPTSSTANQNIFAINRQGTNSDYAGLALNGAAAGDPLNFYSGQSGTALSANTANTYNVNSWNHCCGVASSSTDRKSYLNGDTANRGSSTGSSVPSTLNRVTLGAFLGSSVGEPLFGGVAECALWSVALTEAEVVSLSKGVSPLKVRPQSLVFYAPLWRDVVDLKNSAAFTIVGTPVATAHPRIYY